MSDNLLPDPLTVEYRSHALWNPFQGAVHDYLSQTAERKAALRFLMGAGFFTTKSYVTDKESREWIEKFLSRDDAASAILGVCEAGIARFVEHFDLAKPEPVNEAKDGTITITLNVERTADARPGWRSDLFLHSDGLGREISDLLVGRAVRTYGVDMGRVPPEYTIRSVTVDGVDGPATDERAVDAAVKRNRS